MAIQLEILKGFAFEIHIPPTFYGNVFHFILLMPHLKLILNLFYLVFVSQIKG
jgi:hypothetical protein